MSRALPLPLPGADAVDLSRFFTRPCNLASLLTFAPAGLAFAIRQPGYLPRGFPMRRRLGIEDTLHAMAPQLAQWCDGTPEAEARARHFLGELEEHRQEAAWHMRPEFFAPGEWCDARALPASGGWTWDANGFPVKAPQPFRPCVIAGRET
jgi:hypothetical protein